MSGSISLREADACHQSVVYILEADCYTQIQHNTALDPGSHLLEAGALLGLGKVLVGGPEESNVALGCHLAEVLAAEIGAEVVRGVRKAAACRLGFRI